MEPEAPAAPAVVVIADDLMWAMRLATAVERAGFRPVRRRRWDPALLDGVEVAGVVVDLAVGGPDGGADAVDAVAGARSAGARVIGVGQHEDLALRKRALAAGAERVYAYSKLFADGPNVIRTWLASSAGVGAAR
jgi:ActR/RegA family two-component response regulator